MNQPISATARLWSMFLDHVILCFLAIPPVGVVLGVAFLVRGKLDWDASAMNAWLFVPVFVLYANKDWFGGRSLAKRITGQQVVQVGSGRVANELRCFLRNVTIPVWPVEVAITLFSPSRRSGDWLAGTQVVPLRQSESSSLRQDVGAYRWGLRSVVTLVLSVVVSCGWTALLYRLWQ